MCAYERTKRLLDIALALALLIVLSVPMTLMALLVRVTSEGPAWYWSRRIGRGNRVFAMPKFRTMRVGAPVVATHLLEGGASYVTPIGRVLRRTSLDELPQLLSIISGDMSFVGPRPALFNQHDLVELRTQRGIHELAPGLTGWAQVHGRDECTIEEKVRLDEYYLGKRSLILDLRILVLTLAAAGSGKDIRH